MVPACKRDKKTQPVLFFYNEPMMKMHDVYLIDFPFVWVLEKLYMACA